MDVFGVAAAVVIMVGRSSFIRLAEIVRNYCIVLIYMVVVALNSKYLTMIFIDWRFARLDLIPTQLPVNRCFLLRMWE